jgi:hypothetical protein
VRIKVVLEDVGGEENCAKAWVAWKYSPTHPRIKMRRNVYELKDHVEEERLNFHLSTK